MPKRNEILLLVNLLRMGLHTRALRNRMANAGQRQKPLVAFCLPRTREISSADNVRAQALTTSIICCGQLSAIVDTDKKGNGNENEKYTPRKK